MSTRLKSTRFILIKLFFCCFWLNSCITAEEAQRPRIDSRAVPYLTAFLQVAADHGYYPDASRLRIELSDDVDPKSAVGDGFATVGICHHFPADLFPPRVELSEKYWNDADAYGKEALLYHEMGHCLLQEFSHRNGEVDHLGVFIPISLMNEVVPAQAIYQEYRGYYLNELFSYVGPGVPTKPGASGSYLSE